MAAAAAAMLHKPASFHGKLDSRSNKSSTPFPRSTFFRLSVYICVFIMMSLLVANPLVLSCVRKFYTTPVRYPFLVRHKDALSLPLLQRSHFNESLLELAGVDLAEARDRQQINSILDGTWGRRHRFTAETDHMDDYYRHRSQYLPRLRGHYMRDRRQPLQLANPRFESYWPAFRRLLQAWALQKHHEPHVMQELVHLVKDPIDDHFMEVMIKDPTNKLHNGNAEPGKRYRTCAVVGNSGILLNQSHGSFIDSHDMVMRLNNARISGFEKHVGSKTTISFVNSNILHACERRLDCFCHPYGSNIPVVMYICQVVHFMDVAVCGAKHKAPIIVTDARFDTLCTRIVKYYSLKLFVERYGQPIEKWSDAHEGALFHYSSGMQAVLLAVGVCDSVNIFGFGKSDTARHHYHSSQKAELRLHDYEAEYELYKDLAAGHSHLVPFLSEAGITLPAVHIHW